MTEPIRTCAGCGRKAPKHDLRRLIARNVTLVAAQPGDPGRAVYTCRRLQCFERAASRGAFPRSLRRSVRIDPGLAALYTEGHG